MENLGTFSGTVRSEARDIDDAGTVVGFAVGNGSRPFRWTRATGLQELATLGGPSGEAFAIGPNGDMVGHSMRTGVSIPTVWTTEGIVDLGLIGDVFSGVADAVSSTGQVAGWSTTNSLTRAFVWSRETGGWTRFEVPVAPGFSSQAWGINAGGQVVGTGNGAFVWSASEGRATLPSLVAGGVAKPQDINDAGTIAGYANASSLQTRPVTWVSDGMVGWKIQVLPTPSSNYGFAYSINRRGDIAGAISTSKGYHAALWTH
jgi:probable HAF family extracellular repeat protein